MEQLLEPDLTAAGGASFLKAPRGWLLKQKLSHGFWVFFTLAFFFDLGFAVYFFLFNLYLLDLHFNERVIGLAGGALTLGSVIGTLPAGWLARRTGLRPLLAICLSVAPLLGVARALALTEWAQIGLAFLAGLSMCFWGVCFLPALARLTTEENRASAFSLIFSVSIGTSALGSIVCGYLPRWLALAGFVLQPAQVKRMILIVSCAIVTIGLIPLLKLRVPAAEDEQRAEDQAKTKRRKISPFLLRYLPSMALWTAAVAAFTPFAGVYMSKDLHISMAQIGLVFSASQVVQLCVGLLTPIAFRRLGLVNGIVATQVATAAAIGCLAGTENRGLAIALFLSFSASQWMSTPGLYNLLMSKVTDEERSSAAAMTLFSNAVLQSGATAGAGILFAQFGYPRVLAGIAALTLAAALLFRILVASPDRDAQLCR